MELCPIANNDNKVRKSLKYMSMLCDNLVPKKSSQQTEYSGGSKIEDDCRSLIQITN